MIDGLHIDVPGIEVQALLRAKSAHHAERLERYERELAAIETALLGEPGDLRFAGSRRSPADETKTKIEEHRNALAYADFMAAHVVTAETYRISESELHKLGVRGAARGW